MKKTALILTAMMALSLGVFAQAGKSKPKEKKEIKCAVMPDMKVNIAQATKEKLFADYKGRRYFFCCKSCPTMFKKNPSKYAKHDSIPTPKEKKTKSKKG